MRPQLLTAEDILQPPISNYSPPYPSHEAQEEQFATAFSIIRKAIAQGAFPGAALTVTYQGALIVSQGFGRFTFDDNSPEVRADTIFDLASLTKVIVTTTIAMLLNERGKLVLDEPLAKILPEFVTFAPKHQLEARQAVTIRMLLAHSSGLPAYEKLFEFSSTRDELLRAALTTPLRVTPGTHPEYSDIGFILLGEVLSTKSGEPLDVVAQREIFVPLGMMHTFFNPPAGLKAQIPPTEENCKFRRRVLQGEVNDENAYVMGGVAGHAGLFAPATDITRFAECMLRSGAPILQPETLNVFTHRETSPPGTTRALGWDTPSRPESSSGRYFSSHSFGHLGFTGSSLWIDSSRKLSVTLLTNRTWPDRSSQQIREVRPQVHDALLQALEMKS